MGPHHYLPLLLVGRKEPPWEGGGCLERPGLGATRLGWQIRPLGEIPKE